MDDWDECESCEYYDSEEGYCTAFVCDGFECTPLPCEVDCDMDGNRDWEKYF